MKKLSTLLATFILFLPSLASPLSVNADTFTSNCVTNKIGTATGNQPGCSGSGSQNVTGGAKDLVVAAKRVKEAYEHCPNAPAIAHTDATSAQCVTDYLFSHYGTDYPQDHLDSHKSDINIVMHRIESAGTNGCAQCLGYVGIVLSLISGDNDALGTGYGAANAVTSPFTVGKIAYVLRSSSEKPQPGDIVVSDFNHIAIVTGSDPEGTTLTLIESNRAVDGACLLTDGGNTQLEFFQHDFKQQ